MNRPTFEQHQNRALMALKIDGPLRTRQLFVRGVTWKALIELEEQGLVERDGENPWSITQRGRVALDNRVLLAHVEAQLAEQPS